MEVSEVVLVNETNLLYTVPEGSRMYPSLTLTFKLNNNPYFRYKLYYVYNGAEVVIDIIDIIDSTVTTFSCLCNIPGGAQIYIQRMDYTGSCTLIGELVSYG